MIARWKKHCPYAGEKQPARRQSWREGWFYRKGHGPAEPVREIERKMTEMVIYTSWLQGYSTAKKHLREAKPEGRQ